ncbi:P-loop containing nucleoside triphosphate hydrolase protein [Ascobolus immersus RN42]|uniref:P-loop containing nucleoside triphosphate hydrolase protein n=1 Tax=Ascobolus immersus RN42 TaxID=1160509 RepID=A0A3N4IBU9_ASCIM|nr:P-loop containing nucleoside triphosphate hydrolase protein [Ascobolus immersus RN42]
MSLLRRLYSTSSSISESSKKTIFALSTPPGKSALAIIRISGPLASTTFQHLTPTSKPPKPRTPTLRTLSPPTHPTRILDPSTLLLFFPSPRSATGEDLLELHLHGSKPIITSVLRCLGQLPGFVPAEAGEFTKQALWNGKMGLLEVEELGGVLAAETEGELVGWLGAGERRGIYEGWRERLVYCRGVLEADIDFSEDQGLDMAVMEEVEAEIKRLRGEVERYLGNAVNGELLRDGVNLCLLGAPNVGKSSLLNRVVGREAAIVSSEAGTTRDVVDLAVDVGGFKVLLGDTAGLRTATVGGEHKGGVVGAIEQEGIRRAKKRVKEADILLVVLSVNEDGTAVEMPEEVMETVKGYTDVEKHKEGKSVIVVVNKVDLLKDGKLSEEMKAKIHNIIPVAPIVPLTCTGATSREAMANFLEVLVGTIKETTSFHGYDGSSTAAFGATERQRTQLEEVLRCFDRFTEVYEGGDVVLAAEELRDAADLLGKLTGLGGAGAGDVEEVLGVVFQNFCVGK